MPQKLYLNTLDPQYARYIDLRRELEAYLTEKYGKDINFQVAVSPALRALICLRLNKLKHESDRWSFYAPTELDQVSSCFLLDFVLPLPILPYSTKKFSVTVRNRSGRPMQPLPLPQPKIHPIFPPLPYRVACPDRNGFVQENDQGDRQATKPGRSGRARGRSGLR
jgi:hypothetical protein